MVPTDANPSRLYCAWISDGPVEVRPALNDKEEMAALKPELGVIENSQYFPVAEKADEVDHDPQ